MANCATPAFSSSRPIALPAPHAPSRRPRAPADRHPGCFDRPHHGHAVEHVRMPSAIRRPSQHVGRAQEMRPLGCRRCMAIGRELVWHGRQHAVGHCVRDRARAGNASISAGAILERHHDGVVPRRLEGAGQPARAISPGRSDPRRSDRSASRRYSSPAREFSSTWGPRFRTRTSLRRTSIWVKCVRETSKPLAQPA